MKYKVGGNLGVSKIVGASVILLDTAIGSGELIRLSRPLVERARE
jgi:hypothetical protein